MILVDPRIIEKLTSARDKVLNNIENEMDTVLNSDIPDDKKAKLYAASAKRHLIINAADKETEIQPDACQPSNTTAVLNDIVTSMPTPHIRRAMKFAKFIQDNQIDINDRGELVHNHKVSENTNATDLINEAIRRRQMNTTGSKEFATLLNELNCPYRVGLEIRVIRNICSLAMAFLGKVFRRVEEFQEKNPRKKRARLANL